MADASDSAPADTGADLAAGTDVGGYLIEAKIGQGGMGLVYSAKHPRIGKRVAIKILARAFCGDPAVVARFEQEARVVNEIRHPNIVDVFQFGELADKRSYFVMEWLDGESLSARIDRGAIPAEEAIEILDVMADALQAAHEHNVIHRDLKSDNVYLVSVRGKRTVKLLDFGLAKLSGRGLEDQPAGSTKSGIIVGTPAYMAPEQARSQPVDGRTDVYALGVLAYKMLTGKLPFQASNPMDLIIQQLNAPPPQPIKLAPKTPPALSKLIVRMMAKAPEQRPTLIEIRELFADLRDLAAPPPRAKRETRSKRPTGDTRKQPSSESKESLALDENRQEPSMGKARLSMIEMEAAAGDEAPPARSRATPILIVAAVLLIGVIATVVVMFAKRASTDTAAVATAEPTGSAAGSAAPVVVASGSGAPAPAVEPAPMIEFADDKVGSARAGSGTGSAKRRSTDDDDEATEELVNAPPVPVAQRPGKVFVMLQHPSTIEIDGKVVAKASQGGTFELPPGEHHIKVTAPDRATVNRSLNLDPGGSVVIRIADEGGGAGDDPAPSPAPAPPPPPAPAPGGPAGTPL